MDIKGKIIEIYDTVQVSEKFRKREFVVEYAENAQYPEFVKFELTQDKCDALNGYKVGQDIEVHFNLRGRRWTDPKGETKYFNSLQAWKVQNAGNKAPEDYGQQFSEPTTATTSSTEDENDLPF